MTERFNVVSYFPDGSYIYDLRAVEAEEAVTRSKQITESVGGRTGMINRVMITDMDDICVFDWKYGEGVVFPPLEEPK